MRMDERLNLIIPIPRPHGAIYVHSMPISHEVFATHWLVLSKAFTLLNVEGLNVVGGPRVAHFALKTVAQSMGVWEGASGVERTLLAEIVRLSNVAVPGEQGWQTLPLFNALKDGVISEDEKSEVLGCLVFFTLCSTMHRKDVGERVMEQANGLWGTLNTLSSIMEFIASLETSTEVENTGATAAAVSLPH